MIRSGPFGARNTLSLCALGLAAWMTGGAASGDPSQVSSSACGSSLAATLAGWTATVERAKESQPDWVPALMTLSPLITQLVRWDSSYQDLVGGGHLLNLGAGKGLFLVPTETNEVDIGIPSYEQRYGANPASGIADYQFLLIKQRVLSAPAAQGNYILTAALSAQAPTGAQPLTSHTYVVTPYLLAGKGFGDLDLQAASALSVPTAREATLGTTWATNLTAQYRVAGKFWPEAELNWTHWFGGTQRPGLNQLFMTFGLIAAPIPITRRVKLAVGAGMQVAVAPGQIYAPAPTPMYRNNVVFTGRLIF